MQINFVLWKVNEVWVKGVRRISSLVAKTYFNETNCLRFSSTVGLYAIYWPPQLPPTLSRVKMHKYFNLAFPSFRVWSQARLTVSYSQNQQPAVFWIAQEVQHLQSYHILSRKPLYLNIHRYPIIQLLVFHILLDIVHCPRYLDYISDSVHYSLIFITFDVM